MALFYDCICLVLHILERNPQELMQGLAPVLLS
jgi:hypothetical protein